MTPQIPKAEDPAPPTARLQEATLRGLIAAKVPTGITAVGSEGHFVVQIGLGEGQVLLANAHGEVRSFASLSTLAGFLARLGCQHFSVDTTRLDGGQKRPAQPKGTAASQASQVPFAQAAKPTPPAAAPRQRKNKTSATGR